MMFHVVQYFDAAKSVAVVPQSWYRDGFALWPSYTSDECINKAVRCAEIPAQNWTRHQVKLLKTYGKKKKKSIYVLPYYAIIQTYGLCY